MNFLNCKSKYLLLLPMVFVLGKSMYYDAADKKIKEAMLQERLAAVTVAVDMLATAIGERAWSDHDENIRNSVEYLDNLYQIYGAAYEYDDYEHKLITSRNFETSVFEPHDYPAFIEAISTAESGNIVIGYKPQKQSYRDLHMYFRWMPHYAAPEDRHLVVAGVSEYSITTKIPEIVFGKQLAELAPIFLLEIVLVILLTRLGYVWEMRTPGNKWRGKE